MVVVLFNSSLSLKCLMYCRKRLFFLFSTSFVCEGAEKTTNDGGRDRRRKRKKEEEEEEEDDDVWWMAGKIRRKRTVS